MTAIVFYFKFGEKLQMKHAMGMLLMIVSVVFITNSQETQNSVIISDTEILNNTTPT